MLIGDYVHLTYQGYDEHGIYRKDKSASFSMDLGKEEFDKIKGKVRQFSDEDIRKIETSLNRLIPGKGNQSTAEVQKMQKIIEEIMQEQYGRSLGKINWNTLSIERRRNQKDIILGKIEEISKESLKQEEDFERIIKSKIEEINKKIDGLKHQNTNKVQNLRSDLTVIENALNGLTVDLKEHKNLKNFSGLNSKNNQDSIIDALNALIKQYTWIPALTLQKGDLLEYIAAYNTETIRNMAEKKITEEVKEAIKKEVKSRKVGNVKEDIQIDISRFGIEEENEIKSFNFGKSMLTLHKSSGKTDVILQTGLGDIGASLKNYAFKKDEEANKNWIHTVSGSNLLLYLQDLEPLLVNHYLNLNAFHEDKKKNFNKDNSDAKKSRLIIKNIIAAKAITGVLYGENRSVSELFIVNDNTTGKVKVVSMYKIVDILSKIKSTSDSGVFSVTVAQGKEAGDSIMNVYNFENKRVEKDESGKTRISNLLNDVHKYKLNASLQQAYFQQL